MAGQKFADGGECNGAFKQATNTTSDAVLLANCCKK